MKWRILVVAAAVAGGVAVAARRRSKPDADAGSWADVTDPVSRFGA